MNESVSDFLYPLVQFADPGSAWLQLWFTSISSLFIESNGKPLNNASKYFFLEQGTEYKQQLVNILFFHWVYNTHYKDNPSGATIG